MSNIGHNNPPSPFDELEQEAGDLYGECGNWLDGSKIEDDEQAGAVADLINLIRDVSKRFEENRKSEKQPHIDAGKAVDAKHKKAVKPLDTALDMLKKALTDWQVKKDAEIKAAQEAARKDAEEKQRLAQEAMQSRQTLDDAEDAERLVKEAKEAEIAFKVANKKTSNAKGSVGRATSLRTTYEAKVTDYREAARWLWARNSQQFNDLIDKLAQQHVRSGEREIPGVEVIESKTVV